MNLQAALNKQKETDPSRLKAHPAEIALVAVLRAGGKISKFTEELYRGLGLTGAQYNVLRILEGAGEPLPQQEIAKRLLVSRANVTGLLDKLEAKGMAERLSCDDRRVNLIQLTGRGFDLLKKSFREVTENSIKTMGTLTKDEQRQLVRYLEKLEIRGD